MENKKEQDVVAVRLENIKLKNKLKKKEHQLKSKVSRIIICVTELWDSTKFDDFIGIKEKNVKLH